MVEDPATRRRRRISTVAQAYRESHEVMSAAMAIAIMAGAGYWLDSRYGWEPVLTVCGLIVGSLMAVASVRQLLVRMDKRAEVQRQSSKSQAGRASKK